MSHIKSTVTACLCVLGAALLGCVPAQARVAYVYEKSFGSEGSGSGQFTEPAGVAVNNVTHNVYVVDRGNNRVEEFNSSGTYIGEFNGSSSPTGVFSRPTEIAVDNSGNPFSGGDVYVVDKNHDVVDKFNESGGYLGQLTGTTCEPVQVSSPEVISCPKSGTSHPFKGVASIAVDSNGAVWAADPYNALDVFSNDQPNVPLTMRVGASTVPGEETFFAVDTEEDAYTASGGGAEKINSKMERLVGSFCSSGNIAGVALNLSLGQALVDKNNAVAVCSLSGEQLETFAGPYLTRSRGLGIDTSVGEAASGTVYVSNAQLAGSNPSLGDRISIFNAVTLPTVALGKLGEQQPTSVKLNGTVDPEGRLVTSCVFEYGLTSSYGLSVPCSQASVGSGLAPVAVSAQLTGLTAQREYHYRLVAKNAGGVSETQDATFFTGPVLGGEYVTSVRSTSATLNVSLDANGGDTHYYFEYGPTSSYGAFVPVVPPGADIGSVSGAQLLSEHLQGLQPGAVYHYRLVAEQGGLFFEEPDRVFTTQAVSGSGVVLPDGRAWELVSPADKHGAVIGAAANLEDPTLGEQAAGGGAAIAYQADEPITENIGGRILNSENLATHGPAGWSSRAINAPKVLPPNGNINGDQVGKEVFYLFSPDLSRAVFEPQELYTELAEGVTERTDYIRNNVNETYEPLVSESDPNLFSGVKIAGNGLQGEQTRVEAATADFSHVVIESPLAFTAGAAKVAGRDNLYEWGNGELQFIGEGVVGGGGGLFGTEMTQRAISSDGRWVVIRQGGQIDHEAKYVVRDTVEGVSIPFGGRAPHFESMSTDGSKVFYLRTEAGEELGAVSNMAYEKGELYVFDPVTKTATDLTATHLAGEANADVQNQVSVSEDGSYVYLVAKGVLATGGVKGADNLYVLHEEENGSWTTTYIATLSSEDRPDWRPGDYSVQGTDLRELETRVSSNGRYVTFMSNRSLTGYDNRDARTGIPDEEVFLYHAGTGRLVCVSCNPTGARPVGVVNEGQGATKSPLVDRIGAWSMAYEGVDHSLAGVLPPAWYGGGVIGSSQYAGYQPRDLSDSGRLFFNSTDALVPQDTNGVADTYELEPPGVGSCTQSSPTFSEQSGGCLGLISSGQSASESVFSDASETGDDVFFITTSRLVPEDYDAAYDLYDAHVCGTGWACVPPVVSPPACRDEESCRAAQSPQPTIFGSAPSATFSGAGNMVPVVTPSVARRSLTVKQRLARALQACRKTRSKQKRTACERVARHRYRAKRSSVASDTGRIGK